MMFFPESPFFLRDGFQHRRPWEKLRGRKPPDPVRRRPSEGPGFRVKQQTNGMTEKKEGESRRPQNASKSFRESQHKTASGERAFSFAEPQNGRIARIVPGKSAQIQESGRLWHFAKFITGISEKRKGAPPPCRERPFRFIRAFRRQSSGQGKSGLQRKGAAQSFHFVAERGVLAHHFLDFAHRVDDRCMVTVEFAPDFRQ